MFFVSVVEPRIDDEALRLIDFYLALYYLGMNMNFDFGLLLKGELSLVSPTLAGLSSFDFSFELT